MLGRDSDCFTGMADPRRLVQLELVMYTKHLPYS